MLQLWHSEDMSFSALWQTCYSFKKGSTPFFRFQTRRPDSWYMCNINVDCSGYLSLGNISSMGNGFTVFLSISVSKHFSRLFKDFNAIKQH